MCILQKACDINSCLSRKLPRRSFLKISSGMNKISTQVIKFLASAIKFLTQEKYF